jgi:hypothetical protein
MPQNEYIELYHKPYGQHLDYMRKRIIISRGAYQPSKMKKEKDN